MDISALSQTTQVILCPPFEWCYVSGGKVILKDASADGGTNGGEYQVPAFGMGRYQITNAQYQKFLHAQNGFTNVEWWAFSPEAGQWRKDRKSPMPTAFIGDDLPMTRVSWFDGMAFCAWLSVQLDIRSFDIRNIASWSVRLPTEQEWQRAATGDTDWKYPWGNEFKDGYGNYANQVGLQPSRVGSYPEGASPFGVMDMIGNLWEWCITPWGSDEMNVSGYTYRVFKGGAWNVSNPEYLSATDRWSHPSRGRLNDCGIRVMFVVQNGQ